MDFLLIGGGDISLEGDDTLPERSSEVTERFALWELSERSLRFSFFSLCFSVSLPLSLPSFCLSSLFSLFLCFPLCFLPPTGRSKGTGGGGLGVRGPFFLPCPVLDDLLSASSGLLCSATGDEITEEEDEAFFSFLPELPLFPEALRLGEPPDLRDEGEPLELERSGVPRSLEVLPVLVLVMDSSFLIIISSRLSMFSCSSFISSRWIFCLFISRESS